MELLVTDLAPRPDVPLYRILAQSIKKAIAAGRIKPGQSLPSVRELADSVALSRTTVLKCYEELASQGYIESLTRTGTFVSKTLPQDVCQIEEIDFAPLPEQPVKWSNFGVHLAEKGDLVRSLDCLSEEFNYGLPITCDLPLQQLARYFRRYSQLDAAPLLTYEADPFGHPKLREALCTYLSRARGVRATPDRLVIAPGSDVIIDMVCRLLLDPGDMVAVENPGYPQPRRNFISSGANLLPIPVDGEGLMVDRLTRITTPVKMVYVTPAHQDPKGPVLSLERRMKLLEWAAEKNVIILEDDYDSEYRYGMKPVPAIQSLDTTGSVVYFSSFWRTLGPVVRLGFGIVPERMRANMRRSKTISGRDYPLLDQCALADFIEEGHFERHIHRTRALYSKRRQALVFSLVTHFGRLITVSKETAGLHLLVKFHESLDESAIEDCAYETKVPIKSTSGYYIGEPTPGEYLISFAHGYTEKIRECIGDFARALKEKAGDNVPIQFPTHVPTISA